MGIAQPNVIPSTTQAGWKFTSVGDGTGRGNWQPVAAPSVIRIGRTYAVQGLIAVPSGATNYIPPFEVPVPAGQTVTFIGVSGLVRAATSVTVSINQNGSGITGLTAVVITTTSAETDAATPTACADGDLFAPVVSSISGTPDGLSLTFIFDVTP